MKQDLTEIEKQIILHKGTEPSGTGKYNNFNEKGIYTCKACGHDLYRGGNKFHSGCGWPSFDDEIKGAVIRLPDADGRRTEIICNNCEAHLGHVFEGEKFTDKNTRHCVNSISLSFNPELKNENINELQRAVFASGCFWGTEYHFAKLKGVLSTKVGYAGGWFASPNYKEVCTGTTGHYEAVEITYDPQQISYEELLALYFNTHNPEQEDGQGPDVGPQYRGAIFYTTIQQKDEAEKTIEKLKSMGYKPSTKLMPLDIFYPEKEDYHYNYYEKTAGEPYCHVFKKIL